jgi:sporulation protein YtfJ
VSTEGSAPLDPPGARDLRTHPIEALLRTAMTSLEAMVDVNTVVGDAVETGDGTTVIPVSQVSFGFAAGGAEYGTGAPRGREELPFGGGSGAGVSVRPVAFLVVHQGSVRLLPADPRGSVERLLDLAPEVVDRILTGLGDRGRTRGASTASPRSGEAPGAPGGGSARDAERSLQGNGAP